MDRFAGILSASEIEIVKRALKAAVEGDFFPDWEFETLIGVNRDVARRVYDAWPRQTIDSEEFGCAVVGSMNNLLRYPHGKDDELISYVPEGRDAIAGVLRRLSRAMPRD